MPKKPCPRRPFPRPTAFCIQLEIITWQHAYSMRMTKWSFWGHAKNDHTSRCHSDRPIHSPGCHMHFKDLTQLTLYQWGFILSFTGKLKICTCIAERYKNIPNWYGHRPILHGSGADKFNAALPMLDITRWHVQDVSIKTRDIVKLYIDESIASWMWGHILPINSKPVFLSSNITEVPIISRSFCLQNIMDVCLHYIPPRLTRCTLLIARCE